MELTSSQERSIRNNMGKLIKLTRNLDALLVKLSEYNVLNSLEIKQVVIGFICSYCSIGVLKNSKSRTNLIKKLFMICHRNFVATMKPVLTFCMKQYLPSQFMPLTYSCFPWRTRTTISWLNFWRTLPDSEMKTWWAKVLQSGFW